MTLNPKKILWPTDYSDLSLHAARYAQGLCKQFGATLHVIHVVPPPLGPDVALMVGPDVCAAVSEREIASAAREGIEKLLREQIDAAIPRVVHAFVGNPWSAICAYAKKNAIDLIVIGTHGRTGISHAVIGSTAERIVRHAPCPVLTVKHPEHDFVVG